MGMLIYIFINDFGCCPVYIYPQFPQYFINNENTTSGKSPTLITATLFWVSAGESGRFSANQSKSGRQA